MKFLIIFLGVFCYTVQAVYSKSIQSKKDLDKREEEVVSRLLELTKNETFAKLYRETFGPEEDRKIKKPFSCPVLPPSSEIPTSVHKLRPADIQVVSALGDSLTAGRGAAGGILALLADSRGLSWSIGGDGSFEKIRTLPNILRKYNPNLYGCSTGFGNRDSRGAHLNVARSGDESQHMLEQAKMLNQRFQDDPKVNYTQDWKLITLFIGGNDLCSYCDDETEYSVTKYKANVQAALDYLHANVPRAFVNMVEVLNIEIVTDLAKGLVCNAIHYFVCDCAASPKSAAAEKKLTDVKNGYQKATRDLIATGRYDTRDDFTVVLQPFYENTFLPLTAEGKTDYSYFASDCFHYSKKGQEAASQGLWNNMVEPVGAKRVKWAPGEGLECPSEKSPYLFTNKNSAGLKTSDKKH